MSYANSMRSILRMKPYLEVLHTKRSEDDIVFETGNPKNLAYRLREVMATLRNLDEHEFKNISDKYTFKEQYPPAKMGVLVKVKIPEVKISALFNSVLEEIVRPNEASDIDIISFVISHNNINRLYFPNFDKENTGELVSIVSWAESNNYNVETKDSENGIRIIKNG